MAILFLSFCVLLLLVYAPGAFLLYACNFDRCLSLLMAPMVSCFGYLAMGVLLFHCGVFAGWEAVVLPIVTIAIAAFLVRLHVDKTKKKRMICQKRLGGDLRVNVKQLGIALVANGIIGGSIFLLALDGADSFSQGFDMGHHLAQVFATVQYGNFSTLDVDIYGTGSGGFYPSLLHVLAATVASMFGVESSLALNAEILVLILLVYPIGIYFFGQQVLKVCRYGGLLATILSLCFAGFPWVLLRYCPLLANFCTMAFLPLALVSFMYCFELNASKRQRILLILLFFISMGVVGCAHPNGVFSAAVILFPYCLMRFGKVLDKSGSDDRWRNVLKYSVLVLFVVLSAAAWLFLCAHPAFHDVVTYDYSAKCKLSTAIMGVILQEMRNFAPNLPLALLVFVGLVKAVKTKSIRWIACPYLFSAVMLIVCGSMSSCWIKFLLCGFWYNHDYRIMALFALCSLPLAALGLSVILEYLEEVLRCRFGETFKMLKLQVFQVGIASSLGMALFVVLVCFPCTVWVNGELYALPMAQALIKLHSVNDWNGDSVPLHSEERDFLKEVCAVVPDDALILNMPYDGSGFAYGLDGLNVYYRTNSVNGRMGEDEKLVLQNANKIEADSEVYAAVKRMGVDYLLQLDHGLSGSSTTMKSEYDPEKWCGLHDVSDDTKGYELVLSKGDMRLYRIVFE